MTANGRVFVTESSLLATTNIVHSTSIYCCMCNFHWKIVLVSLTCEEREKNWIFVRDYLVGIFSLEVSVMGKRTLSSGIMAKNIFGLYI